MDGWVVARGLLWCCSGLLLGYCKMVAMVFGVDAGILKKDGWMLEMSGWLLWCCYAVASVIWVVAI